MEDKNGVSDYAKLNKNFLNEKANFGDYKNNPSFGQHIADMDKVEDQCLKESVMAKVEADKIMSAEQWLQSQSPYSELPPTFECKLDALAKTLTAYANYVSEIREKKAAWEAWKHLTPDIYYKMPHPDRIKENFDRWFKQWKEGK